MIYIASDHGGFEYKNIIAKFLEEKGYDVADMGPHEFDPKDDYPDYIAPLAAKVTETEGNKGIVLCRNGVGVCLAATKIKGIRCGLSWNAKHAESSRRDDNTNILALPADYVKEDELLSIVETWLETPFGKEKRHIRRLEKVKLLEQLH
jgi:ribose 5-phosphate isomerase B